MAKRLSLVLQILDGYASVKDFLSDLGMWGPLTSLLLGVGMYFWAQSAKLPIQTRIVSAAGVVVIGVAVVLVLRIWAQVRPQALPEDLARTHIIHLSFRIGDMARDELIIRNRTFEDCTIYGPAVLLPLGGGQILQDCSFLANAPEEMFLDIGTQPRTIIGAIGLEGCVFRRCRLVKIGFAGPPSLLEAMQREARRQQQHAPARGAAGPSGIVSGWI